MANGFVLYLKSLVKILHMQLEKTKTEHEGCERNRADLIIKLSPIHLFVQKRIKIFKNVENPVAK